jgi:hypothetical protein
LNETDKVAIALTTKLLLDGRTFLQRSSAGAVETAVHWTGTMTDYFKSMSFLGFAVQCQLTYYVDAKLRSMPPKQASAEAVSLLDLAQNHYQVFPEMRDRPVVRHSKPSETLDQAACGIPTCVSRGREAALCFGVVEAVKAAEAICKLHMLLVMLLYACMFIDEVSGPLYYTTMLITQCRRPRCMIVAKL